MVKFWTTWVAYCCVPRVPKLRPTGGTISGRKGVLMVLTGWFPSTVSGIRSGCVVDEIVVGIQAEGYVVGNPEDSITAANDRLLIPAVGETHPR